MKYFILTLFFCAFVATAFSAPVAQEEANEILEKFQDAIPKIQKAVKALREIDETEEAVRGEKLVEILQRWNDKKMIETHLKFAKIILKEVEQFLEETRDMWQTQTLSSLLDEDEEVTEIVKQFKEALPKLRKIADGMKKEGKTNAAEKLEKLIENLKVYTVEENVRAHKTISKIVLKGVQFMIKMGKKYLEEGDQSALASILSSSLLDKNEDQEVTEIVNQFKEALPKLQKIATGMRKEGKDKAAEKLEQLAENLKVYTVEENVRAHKTISKIVLKGVQFMIKMGKKYLEEGDQSAIESITSISLIDEDEDQEVTEIVNQFKEALPKLEKISHGLRKDGYVSAADKMDQLIENLKVYTVEENVRAHKTMSKIVLKSVQFMIKRGKKYLEESFIASILSSSLIDEDEEVTEIVNQFKESLLKLQKIADSLRKMNKVKQAEKLEKLIENLKVYTVEENVRAHKTVSKIVLKGVQFMIKMAEKYLENGDQSAIESILSSNLIDEDEDQEVTEIVNQFKEALPKLQKIATGMRKEGKDKAAEKLEQLAENLKVYTVEENVRAHKTISKIVLKGVQFMIKMGKKYLDDEDQSAVVITQF